MVAAHCEAWVSKFQGLLHSIAARQLAALHSSLLEQTAALSGGGAEGAAIGREALQVGLLAGLGHGMQRRA